MIKVFFNIKNIQQEWENISLTTFLEINFLKAYFNHHKRIKHIYILSDKMRLYANIFELKFNKNKNYLESQSLINFFLKFFKIDVLYLTNSFLTSIPSFVSSEDISLKSILQRINLNFSLIIIPDFLYDSLKTELDYERIEVEEIMTLTINKRWTIFNDYTQNLRTKYRKRIRNIFKKTTNLEKKQLNSTHILDYLNDIELLFNQVVSDSNFNGPKFDVSSFIPLVNHGYLKVYGYFLNEDFVGFSSEIMDEDVLYSYFVGFDKEINKTVPIYGKMIIDHIENALLLKCKKLVLGRTANEYKSNFGAQPEKSHIYLKLTNKYLNFFLRPLYRNLKIPKWKQRRPFKEELN